MFCFNKEAPDDVDLERALDTQRVRLLRLVTGWAILLGALSVGPLALPVPRWVRAFFETVLIRAELAAQYLLYTCAVIDGKGDVVEGGPAARVCRAAEAETPSVEALLHRMKVLCEVLDHLPRHARRLVRVRQRAGVAFDYAAPKRFAPAWNWLVMVRTDWTVPRVERPPDKHDFGFDSEVRPPLAMRAGGVGRWWVRTFWLRVQIARFVR